MSKIGIDPTTVMTAGPWVAEAMNLKWPQDRVEVVGYINKIRNLLYNSYSKYKLFDNVAHCICVTAFPLRCGSRCNEFGCYNAITLPPDVAAVEAAWSYGHPLKIRSRWREAYTGIDTSRLPHVEITQMAEHFCTERDLKQIIRLKVLADQEEDRDKLMMVSVITDKGQAQTLEFKLKPDAWIQAPAYVQEITSVVLPPDAKGSITLSQEDGYELSIYSPAEKVPSYRRYRVAAGNCPSTILIQGTKRFQPVYFDTDVVEIGDQLVVQAAASFFKFSESKNRDDIAKSKDDLAKMEFYLDGLISRHRGNAIQDQNPFRGSCNTAKTGLPGYCH